jgi:hypothetical protein
MYIVSHLLDECDGRLARYFAQCTGLGAHLDITVDMCSNLLSYMVLAQYFPRCHVVVFVLACLEVFQRTVQARQIALCGHFKRGCIVDDADVLLVHHGGCGCVGRPWILNVMFDENSGDSSYVFQYAWLGMFLYPSFVYVETFGLLSDKCDLVVWNMLWWSSCVGFIFLHTYRLCSNVYWYSLWTERSPHDI